MKRFLSFMVFERVLLRLVVGMCVLREGVFLVGDDGYFGFMGVRYILFFVYYFYRCGRCGYIFGI